MDIDHILKELYKERDLLEQALSHLRSIAEKNGPRRGRPPGWLSQKRKSPKADRRAGSSSPTVREAGGVPADPDSESSL